ncbi:hypothetical protein QBC40DRAFT_108882 [Triangularia verruculosa]|uniref:Uncharacterized protein n=1 Tax=Triangularia verruculosa TaxID=2587418 RepID=A0AAN6XEE6_9PEZI|nr:hypothetical protein QBC40DRAFT_108882 [Triangularia verruculosa]
MVIWANMSALPEYRGRYGRNDYHRFDLINSSCISAGHGRIGKVEIDCRFMFTKSQWGVLGTLENPAGILYLDLDFYQPVDTRLESATVSVILTTTDGEDDHIKPQSPCPVQFTPHFGPSLKGRETLVHSRRTVNRTPNVTVLGHGAGGLGLDKEKIMSKSNRWSFMGRICSAKGSGLLYDKLQWELKENLDEEQPTHNPVFHTAFALQHNATRFYMTVEISGRLAKFSEKLKTRWKFGGKGEKIVTKIEWGNRYSSKLRLDKLAEDLPLKMEHENMKEIPVSIPDAMSATYRMEEQTHPGAEIAHPEAKSEELFFRASGAYMRLPASTYPSLTATADSIVDSLRLASGLVTTPPIEQTRLEAMDQSSEISGSTTLVNTSQTVDDEEQPYGGSTSTMGSATKRETYQIVATKGENLVLQWLRGVIFILIAMLASVIDVSVVDRKPNTLGNPRKGEMRARLEGGGIHSAISEKAARKEEYGHNKDDTWVSSSHTPSLERRSIETTSVRQAGKGERNRAYRGSRVRL